MHSSRRVQVWLALLVELLFIGEIHLEIVGRRGLLEEVNRVFEFKFVGRVWPGLLPEGLQSCSCLERIA